MSRGTFANEEHDDERADQAGPDETVPGLFQRQQPTNPYDKFMPSVVLMHEKTPAAKSYTTTLQILLAPHPRMTHGIL